MINSKRIIAALACLSIAVNAGPCKPHTTATTSATTTTISEDLSSTAEASATDSSPETTGTTTTAAAITTTAAAVEDLCNNQIYRGTAGTDGYSTTVLDSEADCWDSCVQDNNCKSWRFEDGTLCHMYNEELAESSSPTNEEGSLIGSRDCSPRDYTPCNDEIGFGYIAQDPFEGHASVPLERECAQLCMKTGNCNVWQYDSLVQTCNLFSKTFEDIFTPQADAPQGSKIRLAGSRGCSSDFFKPQLEPCNGQIGFSNEWLIGYRRLPQYKSVSVCARACSIDPLCQTWGLFNGNSDCSFAQEEYYEDSTDICAKGSRNCGVP
jgi:hypothetical protein